MLLVRHCQRSWLIGKTNLQSLLARVKALMWVCQFVALKLLSNERCRRHLIRFGRCRLVGVVMAPIGQNREPGERSGSWRSELWGLIRYVSAVCLTILSSGSKG